MSNKPAKIGMIGTGWRAEFYARIAKALPELFEIVGTWYHSETSRDKALSFGGAVYTDYTELVRKEKPDFVIVSVSKASGLNRKITEEIARTGTTVLMETPPATTVEELTEFYETCKDLPIQVAEQYQLQPMTASRIAVIESGKLGEVYQTQLNLPNGYHSISVHRKMLGVGMACPKVWAKEYTHRRMACATRKGDPTEEQFIEVKQTVFHLDYGEKQAFNDLEGDQVRCPFRHDRNHVRGTQGEIIDDEVYYMKDFETPIHFTLDRMMTGVGTNLEGDYLRGIRGPEGFLFKNPVKPARLYDDEIAVATCMLKTAEFAETGRSFYAIEEACQDTYMGLLTEKAARESRIILATPQIWMK